MKPLLKLIAMLLCAATSTIHGQDAAAPEWAHTKESNPLYGKSFDRFTLVGKYFKAPSINADEKPKLTIGCIGGKLAAAEFFTGALVRPSGTLSLLNRVPQAEVEMRIDEKKTNKIWLEISNNGKTLFFDKIQLIQFLTGKMLGHPSNSGSLSRHLVLGVVEEAENQVIAEFEMPRNATEMSQACSLEHGKRK